MDERNSSTDRSRHNVEFANIERIRAQHHNVELPNLRMCDLNDEISRIDHELSVWKTKVRELKKKHETSEESLATVKLMQEKALMVRKMNEKKFKMLHAQMECIRETYLTSMATCKIESESQEAFEEAVSARIKELTKQRNQLKQKLMEIKDSTEKDETKLAEMNMQITIQKKKNAAVLLRLRRKLEDSKKQEEAAIARLNNL